MCCVQLWILQKCTVTPFTQSLTISMEVAMFVYVAKQPVLASASTQSLLASIRWLEMVMPLKATWAGRSRREASTLAVAAKSSFSIGRRWLHPTPWPSLDSRTSQASHSKCRKTAFSGRHSTSLNLASTIRVDSSHSAVLNTTSSTSTHRNSSGWKSSWRMLEATTHAQRTTYRSQTWRSHRWKAVSRCTCRSWQMSLIVRRIDKFVQSRQLNDWLRWPSTQTLLPPSLAQCTVFLSTGAWWTQRRE